MSRIDELIAELCPEGVRFAPIGAVVQHSSTIRWSDVEGREFRYIDLTSVDRITHAIVETQLISGEDAPSRAQQIVREGDVIFGTTRPTLRRYAVIPSEFDGQIASTGYCILRPQQDRILTNYLFHVIGTTDFHAFVEANQRGASYPAIPDGVVKQFRIPVPPLEAQREIVRVLDLFTTLEAELEAELEARRLQYAHYRDTLLTFPEGVRWVPMGSLVTIGTGSRNTNEAVLGGRYPFFVRSQDPLAIDEFEFDEAAVITAGDGVGVGKVFHFVEGKYALHQRAYRLCVTSSALSPKFLFYFMRHDFARYLSMTSVHASVTSLRKPMFEKYLIPLPPLAEQERIVAILDKFEALVNDLSVGLPAELAARRKQYEYYRDRLLTFQESAA